MKKLIFCILSLLLTFPLCACADTLPYTVSHIEEIPFEEMYAVFKDYEGMNPEQIADVLDNPFPMDGQIPYRGSMFIHGAGGNVLLGSIGEYSGIIDITWTGYYFPIECIRSVVPGMTQEKVKQHLFAGRIPFWTELPDANAEDALRSTFLLTSCGSLHESPVCIELYFFFTADTLTAVKLSVCSEADK